MQSSHNSLTPKIVGALVIFTVVSSGAYYFLLRDHLGGSSVVSTGSTASANTASQASAPSSTAASSDKNSTVSAGTTETTQPNSSVTQPPSTASSYKDGTYTATGSYSVPHGEVNSVTVSISIKDGIVTAVNDTHSYGDRESSFYVSSFDQEISGAVVGKKISTVGSLSRVGGASLTTRGFDNAVQNVLSQSHA